MVTDAEALALAEDPAPDLAGLCADARARRDAAHGVVVTVDERLPPGAAAAVLNTAHEHTDIVLFVDQHERSVLDAIDGRRSAADLCTEAPDFLERLWRHDLVVFDATDVGGRVP